MTLLAGKDAGPMVSPLCDDWCLDTPYRWPFAEPEPFPDGHPNHTLCQQMAMAEVCGWDPTFLAAPTFKTRNQGAEPEDRKTAIPGGTRIESRIQTPYGDFTCAYEHMDSAHVLKEWLDTREDYQKALWVTRQQMAYDEDAVIEQGMLLKKAVGNRGVLGTWFGAANVNYLNHDAMFYHIADWPDEFAELHAATSELHLKRAATLAKAGFDYLFYCVDATEWISPAFYRTYYREFSRKLFAQWRGDGRFILWHTCGHAKRFVEEGFYNELKPDVFETLSEPPVGNLPSLNWARTRLDPAIATKGNIPLDTLLLGTEEDVRRQVRRVREETAGFRHVVGLSDDMLKNTPLRNALAFVDESRRP